MSWIRVRCPCGRCTVSGEEHTIRRHAARTSVQCGGCMRVLATFSAEPPAPLAFLALVPERRTVN